MEIIINKSSLEDKKKYLVVKEIFKFEELTEEQKEKALSKLSDINVDHDWWNFTFKDAEDIGLKITSFDLDRNRHAKGVLLYSGWEVAERIIKNHWQECETFKTASDFLSQWEELVKKYSEKPSETLLNEIKSFFPAKSDKVKLKEPKIEPKEEINKVVEEVEKPKPIAPAFKVGRRLGGEY